MSSKQYKNFSPQAVDLLIHVINMTLNKAEQLSRRNQLPTENPKTYESFEVMDANKSLSENASVLKSKFPRINSSVNEAQPVVEHSVGVDVLSTDITAGGEDRICYEPIKVEILKECPSATFTYMMRARKNAKDIYIPTKIVVTHLHQPGIDISFHMDTKLYPELPSLHLHIFCPNYVPKQVWINGKEYIHDDCYHCHTYRET
ncbi:unnamed protein product [Acanthocheilonema viteae]|uniref:Uncharacterized protein n=1 Tax=Acanthocheilonema viteae TaxID=6277 RepID=A0A498SM95_ACAVI|nr:unnamed protein product [Acanthocheilonema viteae]